jgi:hypothetical protein
MPVHVSSVKGMVSAHVFFHGAIESSTIAWIADVRLLPSICVSRSPSARVVIFDTNMKSLEVGQLE